LPPFAKADIRPKSRVKNVTTRLVSLKSARRMTRASVFSDGIEPVRWGNPESDSKK
jgi:hypothetical protein